MEEKQKKSLVSNLAEKVSASPTLGFDAEAKKRNAVALTAGQLNFNTPDRIIEAANIAAKDGKTKYTPSKGVPELLEAISIFLKKTTGSDYDPKTEVISSDGAKYALYLVFLATLNKGDQVLCPTPYWPTYASQVQELGQGRLIPIKTSEKNGFKLTAELLKKKISSRTKGLILNSPCNPTGSVYVKEELEAIAQVVIEHDLIVYSDECYSLLVYEGVHTSIASLPGMKERTIVIDAASKAFSMTGWRMGWAAAPAPIIAAMAKIQSQTTSNPNSITQYAVIEALKNEHTDLFEWKQKLMKRRDYVVNALNEMGLRTPMPDGAFYAFPNISKIKSPKDNVPATIADPAPADCFAWDLLAEKNVAVISGASFGAPKNVRISYAASDEVLSQAMKLIEEYLVTV